MSAMTEMPAKTARPIGSTDSFLPGIWNAAGALLVAESAAAVPVPEGTNDAEGAAPDGSAPSALPTLLPVDAPAAVAEADGADEAPDAAGVAAADIAASELRKADAAIEETPCQTHDQDLSSDVR